VQTFNLKPRESGVFIGENIMLDSQITFSVLNRIIGDATKWRAGMTIQYVARIIAARQAWRDNANL